MNNTQLNIQKFRSPVFYENQKGKRFKAIGSYRGEMGNSCFDIFIVEHRLPFGGPIVKGQLTEMSITGYDTKAFSVPPMSVVEPCEL